MTKHFPKQQVDTLYLAEGGTETEIMYKFGHDLPHFAMFPLLNNPQAVRDLRGMYERYLDTAAANGFAALMGGSIIEPALIGPGFWDIRFRHWRKLNSKASPFCVISPNPTTANCQVSVNRRATLTH